QKQQMFQPGALLQAQRMGTEKLAGYADETNAAIQKRRHQMGSDAVAVFAHIKVDQLLEESRAVGGPNKRIVQINPALEGEIALPAFQGCFLADGAANGLGQIEDLPSQSLTKFFRAWIFARIGRQIAGRSLKEKARYAGFLLH